MNIKSEGENQHIEKAKHKSTAEKQDVTSRQEVFVPLTRCVLLNKSVAGFPRFKMPPMRRDDITDLQTFPRSVNDMSRHAR